MPIDYKFYGIKTAAGKAIYDAAMREAYRLQGQLGDTKNRAEQGRLIRRISDITNNAVKRALSLNPAKKKASSKLRRK
jgi:ribosomal protein L13